MSYLSQLKPLQIGWEGPTDQPCLSRPTRVVGCELVEIIKFTRSRGQYTLPVSHPSSLNSGIHVPEISATMSKILLDLLATPLQSVAKKLGADYIHSTHIKSPIFDLILQNIEDNTKQETKERLEKIINGIAEVQTKLGGISNQIGEMRLGIKQDVIQIYITNVDSLYAEYMAALSALAKASLEPPSRQRDQNYRAAREDLDIRIRKVKDEVHNDLQHIHAYAALQEGNSLFSLMNAVSLRESRDFISHFCRMKMVLLAIYAVQERGLQLLAFVAAENSGSSELIGKILQNIVDQEKKWNEIVTEHIVELATAVLENPSKGVMVSFKYDSFRGINPGSSPYYWGDRVFQWRLEPSGQIDALNLHQDRYFRLRSEFDGQYLTINSGSQYRVVANSRVDMAEWKVMCTAGGKFRLQSRHEGWILKFQRRGSDASPSMWAETSVPDDDLTAQFSITLYRGNLWGNELKTLEVMLPDTWIESTNKKYRFWLQKDGKLGIYSMPEVNLIWDPRVLPAYVSRVCFEYNGSIKVFGSDGVDDRDHEAGLISPGLGEDYVHQNDVRRLNDEGKLQVLSKAGSMLWTCDSWWNRLDQKKEPSTANPYRADQGHGSWSESYPFSETKGQLGTSIASNFFLKDNIRHLQVYYQREDSNVVEYVWDQRLLQWQRQLILDQRQPETGLASIVVPDSKKYTLRVYLVVGISWNYKVEEWGLTPDLKWEKGARFGETIPNSKLAVETSPGQQVRVYMQDPGDGGSGGKRVTVWECSGDSGSWKKVKTLSWFAVERNYG
ncbi:unnamed protein product [Sphagnum balticum]